MSKRPILIIQMQRLGDLVLTFPLLGRLAALFPGHPLWVMAEERFYRELMPLSPDAVFFPPAMAPALLRERYEAAINLSHREEALALAGNVTAERVLGAFRARDGSSRIAGDWQLYRASLTHNNRHNLFHWADLNGLELVSPYQLMATRWPEARLPGAPLAGGPAPSSRIGLFLGASEADKRPGNRFWASLAGALLAAGHSPVLLGGEAEKAAGHEVARAIGKPALDLCGRFSIGELAVFISRLDLMITPDTGPMHVAAWTGTPTLNLSMGPVNPWETGPFSPGHFVLRTDLSCTGCWQCAQPRVFCKEAFAPESVAALAGGILRGDEGRIEETVPAGQELLQSGRDRRGLYSLRQAGAFAEEGGARMAVSRFWQAYFARSFGLFPPEEMERAASKLAETAPRLLPALSTGLTELFRHLSLGLRGREASGGPAVTDAAFWASFPPLLRPFSGYTHMLLQNGSFAREAFARGVGMAEELATALRKVS